MSTFHSEISRDFDSRLGWFVEVMNDLRNGHFVDDVPAALARLGNDICTVCPESIQSADAVRNMDASQRVPRLDKILECMEDPEFARANALYHLAHDVAGMQAQIHGKHGAPMARLVDPDEVLSDQFLDQYTLGLVERWKVGRVQTQLYNDVMALHELIENHTDGATITDGMQTLAVRSREAAAAFTAFASQEPWEKYAPALKSIAENIERNADAFQALSDTGQTPGSEQLKPLLGDAMKNLLTVRTEIMDVIRQAQALHSAHSVLALYPDNKEPGEEMKNIDTFQAGASAEQNQKRNA